MIPNTEYGASIPVPFWVRSLRTLWRWRPACYEHRTVFHSEDEYAAHWRAAHIDSSGTQS